MAGVRKPNIGLGDYDACNRQARREGIYAGLAAGLFAAVLGQRVMKFNPKLSLFSGVLTGVLSGYYFSQAFLSSHLARLRQETLYLASLQSNPAETDTFPAPSGSKSDTTNDDTRLV